MSADPLTGHTAQKIKRVFYFEFPNESSKLNSKLTGKNRKEEKKENFPYVNG